MKRKLWDMFFMLPFVGVPSIVAVALSSKFDNGGIPSAAVAESARGSLFSSLVSLSGLFLSVMLAVLAIITSMDERPLIKRIKERGDKMYDRLVYAMLGPIFISILLAALAIICIALKAPSQQIDVTSLILVSITIGMATTAMAQVGYVAVLIARMLVYRGRQSLLTAGDAPKKDTPKAAPEPPESPPQRDGADREGSLRPMIA